jgi:hypothetical protein
MLNIVIWKKNSHNAIAHFSVLVTKILIFDILEHFSSFFFTIIAVILKILIELRIELLLNSTLLNIYI